MREKHPAIRFSLAIIVGLVTGVIFVGLLTGTAKFVEWLLDFS